MPKQDFSKRLERRWNKKCIKDDLKIREASQKMREEGKQLRKVSEYIWPLVFSVLFRKKERRNHDNITDRQQEDEGSG